MEHIEEAGVHSGDSACSLPPYSLPAAILDRIREQTRTLALELRVRGLINIQFAVREGEVYILEVNPRASRTVPFVSKAIGVPLAKLATKIMTGMSLEELGFTRERVLPHVAVKEAILPFTKFPGTDPLLGPEMKSTGEVMGIGRSFGQAFAKSQMSHNGGLPRRGTVFISVKDKDKPAAVRLARDLSELGFSIVATAGTAAVIRENGVPVKPVLKVSEGRPHVVDHIKNGDIQLVINTPTGKIQVHDAFEIRRTTLVHNLPYYTTIPGAFAAVRGIRALLEGDMDVAPLQEFYERGKTGR